MTWLARGSNNAQLNDKISRNLSCLQVEDILEALKRDRLIRHSWPKHILAEVQEAKELNEIKRRRHYSMQGQPNDEEFPAG